MRRLVVAGVDPRETPRQVESGLLAGLTIVVTGRLEGISRDEAEDLIRELGGKVGSSVSKSTTVLVVGEDAGTKLAKAEKLGVRTIDEATFTRLTEEGSVGAVRGRRASEVSRAFNRRWFYQLGKYRDVILSA